MALDAVISGRSTGFPLARPVELTCFALCVANAVFLAASFVQGSWLIDSDGQVIATDFVNVWAAGRMVLDGQAAEVYDMAAHKAVEVAALGHSFEGQYPWIYPPIFLFPATLLALFPYIAAHPGWSFLTLPAYAAAVRGIVGDRVGLLFAFAFPGIVANFVVGQNGFVTAALLGGALLFLQRRPILAGCLVGLLTFKPHFGIWIPLILIVGGYWRALAASATVTAFLVAASLLVFGPGSWEAFFQMMPAVSKAVFIDGGDDFAKLQSLIGLVRMNGGSVGLGWTLQVALAATTGIVLGAMWRSKLAFDLKAAALVTGTLLTAPYLFMYDLAALAIAMAFLLRASRSAGPVPGEMLGLAGASLLILVFPLVKAPVGLAAVLVVAFLIARRASHAYDTPDTTRNHESAFIGQAGM